MRLTAWVTAKRRKQEAGVIAGLAVFGWAFPGVLVRLMPPIPATPLVALRLSMAFFTLIPLLGAKKFRMSALKAVSDWRCWILSLGMLIYYAAATPAFRYAPVGEVALIIASAPLFTVGFRVLGRKPVIATELAGAFLALGGVVLMAIPSLDHSAHHYELEGIGILLAVIAAIASAVNAIGNRHLVSLGCSPGAVAQVGLTFFLGLFILPTVAGVSRHLLFQPQMLWILPLGAICTALPTVAVAASSQRMPAVAVTMINPLASVSASVVAAVAIHESPTIWTIAGGFLVVSAVIVASSDRFPQRRPV